MLNAAARQVIDSRVAFLHYVRRILTLAMGVVSFTSKLFEVE